MARLLVVAIIAAACTLPDHGETGPTLSVTLEHDGHSVGDTSSSPTFTLGTLTQYSITVEIDATQGTDSDFSRGYAVTDFTPVFEVPSVTFPDSTYDTMASLSDRTFTRKDPLLVPASAMGQMLHVHVTAVDERGVASNIIDFSVLLN